MSSKIHHGIFETGGYRPSGECIEAFWTVSDDGTVTLVRQYRAAVDDMVLEIVAGTRDKDGEPEGHGYGKPW